MAKLKSGLTRLHSAVFLFGFAGLFGKWVKLPPEHIVFWRVAFASVTIAAFLSAKKQLLVIKNKTDLIWLSLCGSLLAFHWFSFFKSIQISSVAIGLLAYATFPIFVIFLEPLFFKTKIAPLNLFFIFLCVAGIYLIVPVFSLENQVFRGLVWGLGSSLSFALLTLINRDLSERMPSLNIVLFQDLIAALFLLPLVLSKSVAIAFPDFLLLAALGIICTALAHTLFVSSLRHIDATTASIICTLEPVYGIVLAALLLGEIPAIRTIFGGLLILISTALTTLRKSKSF